MVKRILLMALAIVGCRVGLASYLPLEWIKASGKQWINTGYTPACTDMIEMKVCFSSVSSLQCLYCSRGASTLKDTFTSFLITDNKKIRIDRNTSSCGSIDHEISVDTDYTLVVDYNAMTSVLSWNGGSVEMSLGSSATTYTPGSPLAIFASHTAGTSLSSATSVNNYGSFTLYYVKIYNAEGSLIHWYIPAEDGSAASDSKARYGLFDKIDKTYCANNGSAAFTAGGYIWDENETAPSTRAWTWKGGAEGSWSSAENWDPASVPSSVAEVSVTNTVELTPPADFTGEIIVKAGSMTATFDVDSSFSIGVCADATFTKKGSGVLTLKARPGYFPGTLYVNEGTVVLSGNGEFKPSGMFGDIVVNVGAALRVTDSPFESRHSGFTRVGSRTAGSAITEAIFKAAYPESFRVYEDNFATNLWTTNLANYVYTLGSSDYWLQDENILPVAFRKKDYFKAWTRAIILVEKAKESTYVFSADDSGRQFIDGDNSTCYAKYMTDASVKRTLTVGWHTLDQAVAENTGDFADKASRTKVRNVDGGRFDANAIWFGVCCNSLTVSPSATLTIDANQAIAVASSDNLTLSPGTLAGTGCLSVMSGGTVFDPSAFPSFAGRFEIGLGASANIGDATAVRNWLLCGNGSLTACDGELSYLDSSFAGVVTVPAGVSVTAGVNCANCTIAGTGSLTLSGAPMSVVNGFTGEIRTGSAQLLDLDALHRLDAHNLVLGNASTTVVSSAMLAKGAYCEMTPVTDLSGWSTNAAMGSTSAQKTGLPKVYFNQQASRVDEATGELVLTDDPGQFRTVILTNRTFAVDDEWEAAFTLKMIHPAGSNVETNGYGSGWGEGVSIVLQADGPTKCPQSANGRPSTSYGFYLYVYEPKLYLIEDASSVSYVSATDMGGFDFRGKAIDVKLHCLGGVMHATFTQGTKSYTTKSDLSGFYRFNKTGYLTLVGHTGCWGSNSSQPWFESRISNFTGRYRANAATYVSISDRTPMTDENWTLLGQAKETNTVGHISLVPNVYNLWGAAHCNAPFGSFRMPLKASFEYACKGKTSDVAEGFSLLLQSDGTSAVGGAGNLIGKTKNAFGLYHYVYGNPKGGIANAGSLVTEHKSANITFSECHGNYTLDYDGVGGLSYYGCWTNQSDQSSTSTGSYQATDTFNRLQDKPMYLSFFAATSAWRPAVDVEVFDLKLSTYADRDTPVGGFAVAAGATATVKTGGIGVSGNDAAVFDCIEFGSDSTLNLVPDIDVGRIRVNQATLDGSATLAAADGVSITLGKVVLDSETPSGLTLSGRGAFALSNEFEIVVKSAAVPLMSTPWKLVGFNELAESPVPETVILRDENGKSYAKNLSIDNGGIYYAKPGTVILFW